MYRSLGEVCFSEGRWAGRAFVRLARGLDGPTSVMVGVREPEGHGRSSIAADASVKDARVPAFVLRVGHSESLGLSDKHPVRCETHCQGDGHVQ